MWDNWEEWIAQSDDYKLTGEAKPTPPQWSPKDNPDSKRVKYPQGRLADYLGFSTRDVNKDRHPGIPDKWSLMSFLAYQRIFLDYYAPQRWIRYLQSTGQSMHWLMQLKRDLQYYKKSKNHVATNLSLTVFDLRNVSWNHDYFTTALPLPQLFDAVRIPFMDDELQDGYGFIGSENTGLQGQIQISPEYEDANGITNSQKMATISDLRSSVALQHFMEQMQLSGGLYIETLKVIWGEDVANKTLQRPEYLGGSVDTFFINEVESNAGTDITSLGDLAGKPLSSGSPKPVNLYAEEHGLYMCIAHFSPRRSYSDSMDRYWKLDDVYDLPMSAFEGIGDEAVYNWELKGTGGEIFGYIPRYLSWKGSHDRFSGEMRHDLVHWHLGSTFEELKGFSYISPEFMNCNPRTDIFQVPGEPDKFFGRFNLEMTGQRRLSYSPMAGVSYL